VREPLEIVGGLAHCRHDDHDVVARTPSPDDVLGNGTDALGIGDGGAPELLDEQAHGAPWYRGGHPILGAVSASIDSPAVPKATKRERQRQNRDARREAMLEAEKRKRRMRTARNISFLLVPVVILFVVIQITNSSDDSSSSASTGPTNFKTTCDTSLPTKATKTKYPKPGMGIDPSKQYTAVLHTTEGDVTIALDAKQAPVTVNSFVYLACQGFYNGTTFHRIVTDFVDQGGDPKGDGTGGPGYTLKTEPPKSGYTAGSVAMANAGPNTTGSQFFLVVSANGAQQLGGPPYLYSDLGQMDPAGLAVAQQINTFGSADSKGTPTKTITVNGVTVTEGSTETSTTAPASTAPASTP
jgi:cyclophilin family peptidyl-prolyl cis-trans isomerase